MTSNKMSTALGWGFIVFGLIGLGVHRFFHMHLNGAHVIMLLLIGVVSLFIGMRGSVGLARAWDLTAGITLTTISLFGLFMPAGTLSAGHLMGTTSHLLRLIPNTLEFGTADSWIQFIAGALFLMGGLSRPKVGIEAYAPPQEKQRTPVGRY